MYSRLFRPPAGKSFFLFGPRGTGKTTWVKSVLPGALMVDLLESEIFNDLLPNPQRLENLIPADFKDWVVIDEIQKIPELLNEVHRLIEKYKYKFVLTGSSARKLRRKGPNLLAGRALTRYMHPLTVKELGGDFRLEHSLKFGHLPCAYTESDPKAYLESYVRTYLEEEVRQEGLTRNLAAFSRFLETASFSQGSVLNMTGVARECGVERKVVEHYFSILEDILLARRIPVFTRKAKRRMVTHPKFYFFDAGVYRVLRPAGPLDMPEEIDGISLETLLLQEILALNDALNLGYRVHYWRTTNGAEVDFVLYGDRGIRAIEVKRSGRISKPALGGLKSFLKEYPMSKAYFIYGGRRRLREGAIKILPVEDALKNLPEILS